MKKFELYTEVRVIKLVNSPEKYGGKFNKRPPQIGDIGTLIDCLPSERKPHHYTVAKTDLATGDDIWLCDFLEEEIEPVEAKKKRKSFFASIKAKIFRRKTIISYKYKY